MKTRNASPDGGLRARVLPFLASALGCVAAVACAATPWESGGARGEELAVYEATTRYIVRHYAPSREARGRLGAVCLAAGRRHRVPVSQQRRGEEWNPDPGLLRRLEGLAHPVVPISECAWDEHLTEVHLPTGRPALVLGLSHPVWESPAVAFVDVESRESDGYAFRYRCRLLWRVDQWMVEECL